MPRAKTFLHFHERTFLDWQVVIGRARSRMHVPRGLYFVLEYFALLRPKSLHRTQDGMRNSSCVHLSRQAWLFLIWRKPGFAQQPPLLWKIPNTAWQRALGKGARRGRNTQGCSIKDSSTGEPVCKQAVVQKEMLPSKTLRARRACRGRHLSVPRLEEEMWTNHFTSLGLSVLICTRRRLTCCIALPPWGLL